MKKNKSESGLLSLEACIVVVMFIFFMLFLYSFFIVFEARNEMAHVLLSTTNSLSLDTLQSSELGGSDDLSSFLYDIYHCASHEDNGFTSGENWGGKDVRAKESSKFKEIIKERFTAYLSGGDETEADAILKRYHIEGGIEGLDFSDSYISSGKLHISVKYTLKYEYNMFGLEKLKMEQSACSKMWK